MSQPSTALDALHAAHAARFGEVRGVALPLGYGDFAGEVEAIRAALGVLDQSAAGVLLVRGADAEEFLNGLVTSDVKRQPQGHAQPSLLCANKGRILHPLLLVRVKADQFLLVTEPGALDAVAGHLDAYHIREAVEIGRAPLTRVDLLGPGGAAALAALGLSAAAPIASYREAPLLALALPLGAVPRVMVLLPAVHAGPWVASLLAAAPGARLVGYEAYDEARIAAGVPRFGVDYDGELLPAEAALYDRLAFNKGCYVGQEVHARLHYRGHVNRKLGALRVPEAQAAELAPGAQLYAAGAAVGRLTSLARLPREGTRAGIALLRLETLQAGVPLAAAPEGPAAIRTAALATDLGAQPGAEPA
jgi:folate-binding protein YgfZ